LIDTDLAKESGAISRREIHQTEWFSGAMMSILNERFDGLLS
jgi:hypothetical protein